MFIASAVVATYAEAELNPNLHYLLFRGDKSRPMGLLKYKPVPDKTFPFSQNDTKLRSIQYFRKHR